MHHGGPVQENGAVKVSRADLFQAGRDVAKRCRFAQDFKPLSTFAKMAGPHVYHTVSETCEDLQEGG